MAKYDPLEVRLRGAGERVAMTFCEVEQVVGSLPRSARVYRPWWANDHTHVQARAWLGAGFETAEVDLEKRRVVFVRRRSGRSGGTG